MCPATKATSPLQKGVRGIFSPRNDRENDEIPPTPFAKGGGLLSAIVDWTEHKTTYLEETDDHGTT